MFSSIIMNSNIMSIMNNNIMRMRYLPQPDVEPEFDESCTN
jgi:hypothetical protein